MAHTPDDGPQLPLTSTPQGRKNKRSIDGGNYLRTPLRRRMWVKLGACLARVLCEGYLGTFSTFNRTLEESAKVLLRLFKKPKGCSEKHKLLGD